MSYSSKGPYGNKEYQSPSPNLPKVNPNELFAGNKMSSELIDAARHIGKALAEGKASTSQLRKIYGDIKKIQLDFEKYCKNLPLLSPRLAYSVARADTKNGKEVLKLFFDRIDSILAQINASTDEQQAQRFERFAQFMEAIVAYHKFYETKK